MFSTRFLRHAVLFAALALLIAQIVATTLMVNRAKEAQIAAAIDSLHKIGRSTEAAINRSFVQVDAMLAGLPAVLAPFQRDGRLEVSQVNRVLRELNNQNFTYRDILLIGADGLPVATALPVSRRRRLSLPSASSFAEVAARGGSVLIGGPVPNANTGEWTLFFARKRMSQEPQEKTYKNNTLLYISNREWRPQDVRDLLDGPITSNVKLEQQEARRRHCAV